MTTNMRSAAAVVGGTNTSAALMNTAGVLSAPREESAAPAAAPAGHDRACGVLALARMLEFGDSMLPVGAFAFSGALESAVQKGVVHDADTLRDFTSTALEQAARGDAVGLACVMRAAVADDRAALERADREIYCRKLSEEARLMSVRMGRKLAEMCVEATGPEAMTPWLEGIRAGRTPGTYPATLGVLFAGLGLSPDQALTTHQYGVATTILNAALRLMRVTHLDTQRILFLLIRDFERQCAHAASTAPEDMCGYAPMTDILAAVHVRAHVRLFMS